MKNIKALISSSKSWAYTIKMLIFLALYFIFYIYKVLVRALLNKTQVWASHGPAMHSKPAKVYSCIRAFTVVLYMQGLSGLNLIKKEFSNIFAKLIPKGFLALQHLGSAAYITKPEMVWPTFGIAGQYNMPGQQHDDDASAVLHSSSDNILYNKALTSSPGSNLRKISKGLAPAVPATKQVLAAKAKPLLFEYLIKKNIQNGIGLDLGQAKNKSLNYNFASTVGPSASENLAGSAKARPEHKNWYLSEDLYNLISAFFKSIYCLISKPKFIYTPDKIIIEILYYITIPDFNIFKWYNFIYKKTAAQKLKLLCKGLKINKLNNMGRASKQVKALLAKQRKQTKKIRWVSRKQKSIKTILYKNKSIKTTLYKLNNTNITNLYKNKFIILFKLLSSYFKKPIEFNLIRLHKSENNSNILAQLLVLILKKKNIRLAINKLYSKNNMLAKGSKASESLLKRSSLRRPSHSKSAKAWPALAYISGLYINIGGRLMREPIIPRITTKKFEKGAIATGKINFLEKAKITKKNRKGAYTIKIAYAQNLIS